MVLLLLLSSAMLKSFDPQDELKWEGGLSDANEQGKSVEADDAMEVADVQAGVFGGACGVGMEDVVVEEGRDDSGFCEVVIVGEDEVREKYASKSLGPGSEFIGDDRGEE